MMHLLAAALCVGFASDDFGVRQLTSLVAHYIAPEAALRIASRNPDPEVRSRALRELCTSLNAEFPRCDAIVVRLDLHRTYVYGTWSGNKYYVKRVERLSSPTRAVAELMLSDRDAVTVCRLANVLLGVEP